MLTEPIVGVLELASKYKYGLTSRGAPLYLFKPYDDTLPDFIVGSSCRDCSVNQIAIVDAPVMTANHLDRANLVSLLGPVGDPDAETKALLAHYCPKKPAPAPDSVSPETQEIREPLDEEHGWITFHIDPVGCKDIDDAIAYHPGQKLWAITIADVAAAIPVDSDLDNAAAAIGSTFYSLTGTAVRPMLPSAISEGSSSLLPGTPRRGVTLFCYSLDSEEDPWFALTQITVKHSFTYESFVDSEIQRDLGLINKDPHDVIAEFMIRYNTEAAKRFQRSATGILRVQPPAESAAWGSIDPLLARLDQEAAAYQVAGIQVTGIQGSQGHASLNVAAYTHVTSPLRRYADLVNQRCLKALISPFTELIRVSEGVASHLNDRAKANRRWTRDLTFLTHVTPGTVHTIQVIWVDATRVWVPAWSRLLRLRHTPVFPIPAPGTRGRIDVFCDPSRRNWKQRILTAPCV
jgi:exoribonuclease R